MYIVIVFLSKFLFQKVLHIKDSKKQRNADNSACACECVSYSSSSQRVILVSLKAINGEREEAHTSQREMRETISQADEIQFSLQTRLQSTLSFSRAGTGRDRTGGDMCTTGLTPSPCGDITNKKI